MFLPRNWRKTVFPTSSSAKWYQSLASYCAVRFRCEIFWSLPSYLQDHQSLTIYFIISYWTFLPPLPPPPFLVVLARSLEAKTGSCSRLSRGGRGVGAGTAYCLPACSLQSLQSYSRVRTSCVSFHAEVTWSVCNQSMHSPLHGIQRCGYVRKQQFWVQSQLCSYNTVKMTRNYTFERVFSYITGTFGAFAEPALALLFSYFSSSPILPIKKLNLF